MESILNLKIAKMMDWHYNVTPFIKALQIDEFLFDKAKKENPKYIPNESELIDNILESEYYLNRAKEKHFNKFKNKK